MKKRRALEAKSYYIHQSPDVNEQEWLHSKNPLRLSQTRRVGRQAHTVCTCDHVRMCNVPGIDQLQHIDPGLWALVLQYVQ